MEKLACFLVNNVAYSIFILKNMKQQSRSENSEQTDILG